MSKSENVPGSEVSDFRKSILIVDDNETLGYLLRNKLAIYGYRVIPVVDDVEILNYATENPPDLILMDIELCKGSGGTIYKNIKKYRKKILLPILLMSKRLPKKELRKETTRLGAEDWISKPFELDELIIKIKKILDETYPV